MSELRSALDGYRSEALAGLPDARIEEDFAELQRAADLIELERLRRLAEIDRRQLYARDGHLSAASWLAAVHRTGWGTAKADVKAALALEDMPATRRALEEGEITAPAARLLVRARAADPEVFRDAEEAPDPETGETLLTALNAALGAEARSGGEDERTPAQRRADALAEVWRGYLDRSDRPEVAGERPHVVVTVNAEALPSEDAPGSNPGDADHAGPCELNHVGPVGPDVARRVACDATVGRVVTSGRSEPLDVGRRTSVVPSALRRAVIVRDGHCRFPGCDRPHTWCDAHHVTHWADGGPTSLGNLVLMCRRHHRMVHERGEFRLALEEGRAVFRRPDGSILDGPTMADRAPP